MTHSKLVATAMSALLSMLSVASLAQTGSWKTYPAYTDITKIERAGSYVFVVASGGLYSYNTSDESITTYDKVSTLSDSDISDIAWCSSVGRLVVLYSNYNIDLLETSGDVTNVSDYYNKTLTYDKTVNSIRVSGKYAYIATGFGILKLSVSAGTINETYNLGVAVNDIVIDGSTLYAATTAGLYVGDESLNLADKANWEVKNAKSFTHLFKMSDGTFVGLNNGEAATVDPDDGSYSTFFYPYYTSAIYDGSRIICFGRTRTYLIYDGLEKLIDKNYAITALCAAAEDNYYWTDSDNKLAMATIDTSNTMEIVSSGVCPDGPANNYFGVMRFTDGRLYTCGGYGSPTRSAGVQVLDDGEWTIYDDSFVDDLGHTYNTAYAVDVDPSDPSHVMMGAASGLYEFQDGSFVCNYNRSNSPLQAAETVSDTYKDNYTLVTGLVFDDDGALWCLNSIAESASLFAYDGSEWTSFHNSSLLNDDGEYSMDEMGSMMFDSRGLLWFGNNYWSKPALICFQPSTGGMAVYDNFVNQDGSSLTAEGVTCIAEDGDGDIWIGTAAGPLVLDQSYIGADDYTFTQPKVPRNDGTSYADYLLDGVSITSIAIDGAGRKWFGTESGAYLISEDNLTQEEYFTSSNSALPSDIVEAIAINGSTGEVFFGTDKGLCSYMGDATDPADSMTNDNVYAYPNPVRPGYTGKITIVGLTADADVKIATTSGALVAQGRSNGGMFIWDGCDTKGRRVASGIYMVETATSDGGSGCVCKIAIVN